MLEVLTLCVSVLEEAVGSYGVIKNICLLLEQS